MRNLVINLEIRNIVLSELSILSGRRRDKGLRIRDQAGSLKEADYDPERLLTF